LRDFAEKNVGPLAHDRKRAGFACGRKAYMDLTNHPQDKWPVLHAMTPMAAIRRRIIHCLKKAHEWHQCVNMMAKNPVNIK
jgi:hypothetical protein